jgi:ribokinase
VAASICVVGSLNVDLVCHADRLPRAGETLLARSFATHPGGKGANQAVAAARAAARPGSVSMIGAVGDDAHGAQLLAALGREDVDVSAVAVRRGSPSGIALITVDARGENHVVVASGANATLAAADVERAAARVRSSRLVLAQLETPLAALAAAQGIARRHGARVLLNAAPARALPASLFAGVDLLVANEGEAQVLCGAEEGSDPERLARELAALGPRTVVLTLGARGALAVEDGRTCACPAFDVRAVDTTAAGDAFAGALAVSIVEEEPLERALRFACAAGALAVTRAGAIPSLPRREELRALALRAGVCGGDVAP